MRLERVVASLFAEFFAERPFVDNPPAVGGVFIEDGGGDEAVGMLANADDWVVDCHLRLENQPSAEVHPSDFRIGPVEGDAAFLEVTGENQHVRMILPS